MSPTPAILFVNSKITSDTLTPEVFREWYESVHIPDIFVTSGIKSAFRYQSTTPDKVERPFLALYPIKDIEWLSSDEFKSIPVHSDLLPNESKAIFELADFDTRYYETLDTKTESGRQGPAKVVVVVQFDSSSEDPAKLFDASTPGGKTPVRSRVLKLNFSRQNRLAEGERQISKPPAYLGIYEYDELPEKLQPSAQGAIVKSFKLLKAFGNTNVVF
ncbi:hypothetical protein CONLIGDRAFT_402795 [Coniochaeta ligniaria NRRL 30616]|uniref:EthD domain-containing protein n=1 Tax=Coniochaeta ligniaria NRRL 30616 TaxID=1408157 RepID=A0A1J7JI56_9PEZI|nr:hypothetical protein CONLIGDRAFT_402795 [Coniochaeta ligniaria NRRL 30616]